MDKKGDLTTEELVKSILVVIGIFLLAILSWKLYSILTVKTDTEQARSLLLEIKNKLDYMDENEILNDESIILAAPKGWYVTQDEKDSNRLCICSKSAIGIDQESLETYKKQKEYCENSGFCETLDYLIKIRTGGQRFSLHIGKSDKTEPFYNLEITRQEGIFYLTSDATEIFFLTDDEINSLKKMRIGTYTDELITEYCTTKSKSSKNDLQNIFKIFSESKELAEEGRLVAEGKKGVYFYLFCDDTKNTEDLIYQSINKSDYNYKNRKAYVQFPRGDKMALLKIIVFDFEDFEPLPPNLFPQ